MRSYPWWKIPQGPNHGWRGWFSRPLSGIGRPFLHAVRVPEVPARALRLSEDLFIRRQVETSYLASGFGSPDHFTSSGEHSLGSLAFRWHEVGDPIFRGGQLL